MFNEDPGTCILSSRERDSGIPVLAPNLLLLFCFVFANYCPLDWISQMCLCGLLQNLSHGAQMMKYLNPIYILVFISSLQIQEFPKNSWSFMLIFGNFSCESVMVAGSFIREGEDTIGFGLWVTRKRACHFFSLHLKLIYSRELRLMWRSCELLASIAGISLRKLGRGYSLLSSHWES